MYVLVFWVRSKTRSIVDEGDLYPNMEEGGTTSVKYTDNKKYKAKILKKSRKFI